MAYVSTSAPYNITSTSFTVNLTVSSNNGNYPTSHKVNVGTAYVYNCINLVTNTKGVTSAISGYGTWAVTITGLTLGTTYYIAGASYCAGETVWYGSCSLANGWTEENPLKTFQLIIPPVVNTAEVTNITGNGGYFCGELISNGGGSSGRGMDISTSNPPTFNFQAADGLGSYCQTVTNLQPATTYYYRAYAWNGTYDAHGSVRSFTTSPLPPVVTTSNVTSTSVSTATGGGNVTSDGGGAVTARGVCWSTTASPTIANSHTHDGTGTGSFTSTLTSLSSHNTLYYVRAYATNSMGTTYGAQKTIVLFNAPTGLHANSIEDKQILLHWVNNSYNDDITVWYKKENQAWVLYSTVADTTSTIWITGLSMNTQYTFQVINNYGASTLGSNQYVVSTTVTLLPPFCSSNSSYDITGSTCGASTGRIQITNEDYTIFYNFSLHDIQGNTYTLTDYYWSGLTAGWYFITATVNPLWYYYYYGNDACTVEWVKIEDTDTTISLDAAKIRPAVCQGFGIQTGRIVYQFQDSGSSIQWTFSIWNSFQQLQDIQTIIDISNVVFYGSDGDYYGILENNLGCRYLIDLTQIKSEKIWTVEGIQRLYLTPWSVGLSYNYYDSTSEDWYVAGIDAQQFTSTKIAEFIGLTDFWYEIKLDTATMSYSQVLQKNQDGLTYLETVNVNIPHADNSKWKELTNVLSQRYTIVFQDNNDNWWTCFYRSGAEVRSYTLAENQYQISFINPSVNKMLTSMDYNYVKLHIL